MPPSNIPGQTFGDLVPSDYPGERLGIPASGPGSVARFGRRIIALVLDWGIASLVTAGLGALIPSVTGFAAHPAAVPLVFGMLQFIFIATVAGSMGHRLLGLRLVPLVGGYIGIWRSIVRTVLLCLVVPVLVWDSDQRGFHDKIAGTVLIRG